MATEKIFNTRILMKVDTLEAWNNSTLPLKKGELAFATVAATAGNGLTEPVVMVKIGEDGVKTFKDLPWNFYAKASDVIAAAKSEDTLRTFINGVIADAGIASNDAMEALAKRVTTAEGEIDTLQSEMDAVEKKAADNAAAIETIEGRFGADTVAAEIATAIANLKLGETYAAKVHTHTKSEITDFAHTHTKAEITDFAHNHEMSEVNGLVAELAKKVDKEVNKSLIADSEIERLAGMSTGANKVEASVNNGSIKIDGVETVVYTHPDKHAIADVNGLQGALDGKQDVIPANTYDAHGAAAQALTDAKAYTDAEVTEWIGDRTVGTQISEAIANYTNTTDMNSAIATAKKEATDHADGLNTAMNTRVEALEAIDHTHSFVESELNEIKAGDVAKWNAAEQNAKDYAKEYADGLDKAMDERVDALEAKFGDGEGNVEAQIAAAVAAEAELREDADKALQDQIGVATAEGVTATGLHARIEELESLVGDDKVSDAIAAAVKVEKERAEGIEGGLETRLAAVEADYLTSTEEKALQDQITANANAIELLTNGVSADEVDGVNDLIQYVKDHGTEVTGIKADIKTNADDIDALEGRMTTAETAIGTKAAQTDLEALAGRVTTIETEHNTEATGLKARLTAAEADIDVLQSKVGDKTVSEQITAVTNPLNERVVALEAVDHSHANAAELDKFVDGDKAKLDSAVQTVTAGTGLTATKTGTDVAIAFDDTVTFVFDCGSSAV